MIIESNASNNYQLFPHAEFDDSSGSTEFVNTGILCVKYGMRRLSSGHQQRFEKRGVKFIFQSSVTACKETDGAVSSVVLKDGSSSSFSVSCETWDA